MTDATVRPETIQAGIKIDTPGAESEWANPITEGHPMLDQLVRSNSMRMMLLNQKQRGLDLNRLMLVVLIEDLYPEFKERQEFEFKFQQSLASALQAAEEQIDRETLQAGAGGLIVPAG